MSPTKMSLLQMFLLMSPFFKLSQFCHHRLTLDTRHSAYGTLLKRTRHSSLVTRHSIFPFQASLTHSSLVTRHSSLTFSTFSFFFSIRYSFSPILSFFFVIRHSSLNISTFSLFFVPRHLSLAFFTFFHCFFFQL